MADFPEKIGYRWTDGDDETGTPYSLTFDNLPSAISFIVSQRNNYLSADEILDSLFDVETGKALSDASVPVSSDDVTGVAATQGTALPESAAADPETEETLPAPVSSETTATANTVGSSIEASQTSTPVSSGLADTTPVDLAPSAETTTPGVSVAPAGGSDAESVEGPSDPDSGVGTVQDETVTGTPEPEAEPVDSEPSEYDDEDDDFDAPAADPEHGKSDDEPEEPETAPSIGTPTTETPGVTGTQDGSVAPF